ncbi:MAG TPA: cytochrome P460 family protein [bacterium]|nr:cytochrome P460 family protein [bacterium]
METLAHCFGPLHPPMTHFPIVCSILAVLAFAVGTWKKTDWLLKSASALWILTFLSAVASVVLGHLFSFHLGMITNWSLLPPPEAVKGHLRFHAILGTSATLLSILTFVAAMESFKGKAWPSSWMLALGIVVATLFGVAGHEGGEMVYGGEDENLPASASPVTAAAPTTGDLFSLVQDYRQNLVKVNDRMWNSRTHGHRWVNTYVSKEAVTAYKNSDEMPEGALVVKESFQDEGGKPSQTPGPLYVMRKGKLSDSPQTKGWQYAMRWDKPVPGNPEGLQMPVTWLSGDEHLNSCMKCHSHFKSSDYLGGVPADGMNK